jgi:UDP-3-O-[3-hydroxymyristoyl] glucosamine N-acyltransferase LpxD
MRIRDGFTLDSVPALRCSSEQRFLFLDEPGLSGPDSLVVVGAGTPLDTLASLQAALVLAEEGVTGTPESLPVFRIRDARSTLAALLHALSDRIEYAVPFTAGPENRIHPTAFVEGILEGGVTVEAGVVVEKGSFVGSGTRLEANSVIRAHTVIGRDCVVQSGAVIGCAGFGFFGTDSGAEQMPHLAGVRIGAQCFIGANTVIAAGVLHPTEIGDGCKLDSHVQIAHNVRLGAHALLASQSGIAGSTVIGINFRMGGAASVAGHLRLGDNVSVAAKAGVTKNVADGMTVAGFPARPIAEWRRDIASNHTSTGSTPC